MSRQKGALVWVAFGIMNGLYGFKKDEQLGLVYMQMAADEGIALAQYQLALYYVSVLSNLIKNKHSWNVLRNKTFLLPNGQEPLIMQILKNLKQH